MNSPLQQLNAQAFEKHIEPVRLADYDAIVAFHRASRVVTNLPLMRDYTLAEVVGHYYENLWMGHLQQAVRSNRVQAIKLTQDGQILGFSRFGLIFAPQDPAFDSTGRGMQWGELHQIYVDPACQKQGLGRILFRETEKRLAQMGAAALVIKMLEPNRGARAFCARQGALAVTTCVADHEQNGTVFAVPCALYAKRLTRPEGRVLPWPVGGAVHG